MAKRKQKRKQKQSKKGTLILSIGILLFLVSITWNSISPFSDQYLDWQSIYAQMEEYAVDASTSVSYVDGEATVHFIDVGQGNCVLISTEAGAILLDGGENDQGKQVAEYIRQQEIESLSYIVASHPHSDHIGGLDDIMDEIPTEVVIMPELKSSMIPTTRTYEDFLDSIERNDVEVKAAKMGDTYSIGEGSLTILGPTGDYKDLNNASAAARFEYGKTSFLYTADMEAKAEKNLVDSGEVLQSSVFVMGHHGSSTSNSEALLERVRADYYVIQSGYGNSYGHPHKEALNRVERLGGELYRCDIAGTVVFTTDGKELTVTTEK